MQVQTWRKRHCNGSIACMCEFHLIVCTPKRATRHMSSLLTLARHSRLLASRALTCSLLLCLPLTGTLPLDWSFLQSISKLYFSSWRLLDLAADLEVPEEFVESQSECTYSPKSTFVFLKEWNDYGGESGETLQKALSRIGLFVLSDELEKKFNNNQGKKGIILFKVLCSGGLFFLF